MNTNVHPKVCQSVSKYRIDFLENSVQEGFQKILNNSIIGLLQTFANLEADCYQCTGRGPSLHVHHFRDFYIAQLPKDFQPLITKKILDW